MNKLICTLFIYVLCASFSVQANTSGCDQKINRQSYMHKGSADSGTPANKLYNFEKLRKDLKEQMISADKIDDKKIMCMHELFTKGIADSSRYWANRGASEGCFRGDKIPPTRPESCSESTWKEFRKSRQYLKGLQEELKKDLQPLAAAVSKGKEINPACAPSKPMKKEPVAELFKTAEEARTNLCCGSPGDNSGAVRAVYSGINFNQCLAKIKETNEEIATAKGLAMCSANIVAEAVKTIWDSIKGLWNSISEFSGMMSTMKELITNKDAREQFVNNLQKTIKEFLNSRGVTFNQCLNQYEQSMYICEVTGSVIGAMVDIGAVAKLYKIIRTGKAAGEISDFLRKSPKGAAVLDSLKKAEDFTASTAGKAKTVAKDAADKVVQQLAKDTRAYTLAAQMLAKDISFDFALRSELRKPKTEVPVISKVATKVETKVELKVELKVEPPPRIAGSEPTTLPGSRDHSSHQFEVGEDVAIPRNDGSFTKGKITSEIVDDQGVKKYVTQFETPDGDLGRKIISKDDLHEQYDRFYKGEKANLPVRPTVTPKLDSLVPDLPKKSTDSDGPVPGSRDHQSYKFEPSEEIVVPRSDGSFSKGQIASEFKNADGSTSYVTTFETSDKELARKVIAKDDLHRQYDRFYKGEKANLVPTTQKRQAEEILPPADDFEPMPKAVKKADVEDAVIISETPRVNLIKDRPVLPNKPEPLKLSYSEKSPEADLPKVETPKVETPKVDSIKLTSAPEKPAPLRPAPVRPASALPADPANQIHHLNQKAGYENFRMNDKQRADQARNLGITNDNRLHAQDYTVNRSARELDDVLSKVFTKADGIDVGDIRRMLAHAPENGFVTPGEFAQAKKFVELIEKKGGTEYLKSLGLNNTQIDNLNYLTERLPLYAKYSDPSVKSRFEPLEKKIVVADEPKVTEAVKKDSPLSQLPAPKELPKVDEVAAAAAEKTKSSASSKIAYINERDGHYSRSMSDKQRSQQALELGITDDNRIAGIEFKAPSTNKEAEKVFAKVLPQGVSVNVKELRTMLSYAPGSGYQRELHHAQRLVKAIEEAGGIDALKTKGLTRSEAQTLNQFLERIPEYAKYADPNLKTTLKPIPLPEAKAD